MADSLNIEQCAANLAMEFNIPLDRVTAILKKLGDETHLSEADSAIIRSALQHSVEKTLHAFETTEHILELFIILSVGGKFHEMFSLLYSIDELRGVVADALIWMKRNEDALVKTGFATQYARRRTDFDTLCGRLYFTKIPAGIKAVKKSNGFQLEYAWKSSERITFNPTHLPPDNLDAFVGNSFRATADSENDRQFEFDTNYANGATIKSLSKQTDWIEQRRGKIFKTKTSVLEAIHVALKKNDHAELWNTSIRALADTFDREEIETLLRLDPTYENITQYEKQIQSAESPKFTAHYNGGVSELLWLVGYCELELTNNSVATFRKNLGDLVKSHPEYGNCLIPSNVMQIGTWMATYLDLDNERRKRVDNAFVDFWSDSQEHVAFWKSFSKRLDSALETEFTGDFSIKAKGRFKNAIAQYAQWLEEQHKVGQSSIYSNGTVTRDLRITKRSVQGIAVPTGTTWADVTITLKTKESVQIKVKGQPAKTYLYSDLGFKNNNTNNPDRNWLLLKAFAKNAGEIVPAEGQIKDTKKRVSDLRKGLSGFLDLPADASIRYKNRTYTTTFHINSEIAEDRKKRSVTAMPSAHSKRIRYEDSGAATEMQDPDDQNEYDDDNI